MRIFSILYPTDFSDTADHALGVAVDLATRHGAVLHLFHGLLLHANSPTEPLLDACAAATTAQAAQLVEQDPTRRLTEVHVSHLHAASPFEAIMERVTQLQPDLIVMGTHGRSASGDWGALVGASVMATAADRPNYRLSVPKVCPKTARSPPKSTQRHPKRRTETPAKHQCFGPFSLPADAL